MLASPVLIACLEESLTDGEVTLTLIFTHREAMSKTLENRQKMGIINASKQDNKNDKQ